MREHLLVLLTFGYHNAVHRLAVDTSSTSHGISTPVRLKPGRWLHSVVNCFAGLDALPDVPQRGGHAVGGQVPGHMPIRQPQGDASLIMSPCSCLSMTIYARSRAGTTLPEQSPVYAPHFVYADRKPTLSCVKYAARGTHGGRPSVGLGATAHGRAVDCQLAACPCSVDIHAGPACARVQGGCHACKLPQY